MFATRRKLRWPGAVTTVGSSSTSLARPTLPGPPSRCLSGTAASSEAGSDGHDRNLDEGDFSGRRQLSHRRTPFPYRYTPTAYEPMPVSYADILSRAVSTPIADASGTLRKIHRALHSQQDETALPLDHVLGRSIRYLTTQSAQIQGALSAVAQDVSSDAVPKGYTQEFDAIRAHHLGRWYAKTLALKYERGQIKMYLNNVAKGTKKARDLVIFNQIRSINEWLDAQKTALNRAMHDHRPAFEAVVYAMVCELRAARRAQQWHKVWTLERKLTSTASMFLASQTTPLSRACHTFLDRDDERMIEISMSRMAEWNDSYAQMYNQDMLTRKQMNLVKRYWAVFNGSMNEKPWQGEAVVFTAKSPTTDAKEIIVIRHDQLAPPSPLWPRVWRPVLLGGAEPPAGSNSDGAPHKTKLRMIRTAAGIVWTSRSKGKTGKRPRSEKQTQFLPSTHVIPGVREA